MTLLPHHREDLRKSGLSDATIDAAGIYSETSHDKLASLLGYKRWAKKNGPALVFPFQNELGAKVLYRLKPDNPRRDAKGKIRGKYLSPKGSDVRLYVPPSVNGELVDADKSLLVTEGEKKSLKASQDGFPCVGLAGVDCWHTRRSSALIADLERIKWKGRKVYIVFDSDAADNPAIQDNESLLAAALQKRGARVKIVRLPAGADGGKVGLDDFLVANGADELHKLLTAAEDPEPPSPDAMMRPANEADPAGEARVMIQADTLDGVSRLRFWRGTFWRWKCGAYREVPNAEVRARVVRTLNRVYFRVGNALVGNVLDQLRAQAILWGENEPPAWLEKPPRDWEPRDTLATRAELVHLPSRERLRATPRLFATVALDYDLPSGPTIPEAWLQFLETLWPEDDQSPRTLQEWFGYSLTPDTRRQKILLLIGPRRSGKGTIGRVLRALVGPANVAGPTLASLGGNFGLWPLIGKSLAIISDARLSGRADQAAVVERLLNISGEDALTIDRKNLEPVTCQLPTRLMLLGNELPRLGDASAALSSRFVILRLTESWLGREDHDLTDRLLSELGGILWWAIEGWHRLRERGRFVQPESGAELAEELEALTSPIGAFVRDRCGVGPRFQAAVSDLYDAWKGWCEKAGRKPGNIQSFGRDLRASVPTIRLRRQREDGGQVRTYDGIGLLPPTEGE